MDTSADHHKQPPSDGPSTVAARRRYPRWVLLENDKLCTKDRAGPETVAYARNYRGRHVRFSIDLAAPPALSRLRVHVDGVTTYPRIMAAHSDSVLVEIETPNKRASYPRDDEPDYFVYCAGDAAASPSRPPSLSILPPCYLTKQEEEGRRKQQRSMHGHGAGLLRRGGTDEVLVARLDILRRKQNKSEPVEAELCVLRSSEWEWDLKRLPVIHDEGKRQEVSLWETDKVIPVGERFLFWVDYCRGIIFSDVWEETPELRYVSLPVKTDTSICYDSYVRQGSSYRTVCATDAGSVRFVEISHRCCCGCPGTTNCTSSRYAFTITTWALRMDDDMTTTWDKVGFVDCDELWSLPGYHGVVPRTTPAFPTVSLEDPDVLCLVVREEDSIWMIEVDTRFIELRSIFSYDDNYISNPDFVASSVSQYFNPSLRSCHPPAAKRHEKEVRPIKMSLPQVAAKVLPVEMLKTLREIPDLAHDDMLRTYSVLKCDESRFKFRCLLALPMDMRKGYCLVLTGN